LNEQGNEGDALFLVSVAFSAPASALVGCPTACLLLQPAASCLRFLVCLSAALLHLLQLSCLAFDKPPKQWCESSYN
jgi:hypothetical protein